MAPPTPARLCPDGPHNQAFGRAVRTSPTRPTPLPADRQLHRRQVLPGAQRPRGQRRQALYLGGEFGLEPGAEPPFSPSASSRAEPPPAAGAETGLASQIASLTSTICSDSAPNCW